MNYVLNIFKNQTRTFILKALIVICLFFIGSTMNAQDPGPKGNGANQAQEAGPKANSGVLAFDTEEIDYGVIQQNADGVRIFKFTNTGKEPIVISQVKTSCGCTSPTYSKEPVAPGEAGEIQIKYATNRIGKFTKTITIISNASEPNKVIKIKGEVLNPEN